MTKLKLIGAALALALPTAAFAADAGCCADKTCCKDGADCCKDGKAAGCCDDHAKGGDAGHDMSGMKH